MKISLNNIWLTNDGVADLRAWTDAHGLTLNGRQLVQDAEFLRALAAQPLGRGNKSHTLVFSVTQQFPTVAQAAAFALTGFTNFPPNGSLSLTCGAYGETPVLCTASAVLEQADSRFYGTRVDTTFTLRLGLVTTLAPAFVNVIDGGTFSTLTFTNPAAGTLDGGNLADALTPVALNLDGGSLA